MDKWYYIKQISDRSNRYGNYLILLMDTYDKTNLDEITLEEAKEFYEKYFDKL